MSIGLKKLPPFSAFLALESVVRHVSFTHAARELNVSQAAVSQQVKVLEDYLGLTLIVRERPRIRPTSQAGIIATAVRNGVDGIEAAVNTVRGRPDPNRLALATTTAFSSYWLMPRLTRFFLEYPDLEVNLLTKDQDIREGNADFDIGIVFTDRGQSGFANKRIFGDEIVAVCRPGFRDAHPDVTTANDLPYQPLLQLESDEPWIAWREWFSALGVDTNVRLQGPHFTSYILAIQAALEGQGIALGWRRLVQPLLQQGALIQVVPESVVPDGGYDLIIPDRLSGDAGVRQFETWLMSEASTDW